MNLQEGTRRILILALLFWLPVPLYMAWEEWPESLSIFAAPDRASVRVGGDYLSEHPLTAEQKTQYLKHAEQWLRSNRDYYSEGTSISQEQIESMAFDLAAWNAVDDRWDLRLKVWFIRREYVWQVLGLFLVLPLAAAFVFYKIGVPVLAWALAGFKAPPSSEPQD